MILFLNFFYHTQKKSYHKKDTNNTKKNFPLNINDLFSCYYIYEEEERWFNKCCCEKKCFIINEIIQGKSFASGWEMSDIRFYGLKNVHEMEFVIDD